MKGKLIPVKVLGMYASKISGFLRKQVQVYLRFQFPDNYNGDRKVVGEGTFDIPATDLYGTYPKVTVGKIILLGKGEDGTYKYLGPEGDWETMMNMGAAKSPREFVSAESLGYKFTSFSESVFDGKTISVTIDGQRYSAIVDNSARTATSYNDNPFVNKLLRDLAGKLGYTYKDKTYLD